MDETIDTPLQVTEFYCVVCQQINDLKKTPGGFRVSAEAGGWYCTRHTAQEVEAAKIRNRDNGKHTGIPATQGDDGRA